MPALFALVSVLSCEHLSFLSVTVGHGRALASLPWSDSGARASVLRLCFSKCQAS